MFLWATSLKCHRRMSPWQYHCRESKIWHTAVFLLHCTCDLYSSSAGDPSGGTHLSESSNHYALCGKKKKCWRWLYFLCECSETDESLDLCIGDLSKRVIGFDPIYASAEAQAIVCLLLVLVVDLPRWLWTPHARIRAPRSPGQYSISAQKPDAKGCRKVTGGATAFVKQKVKEREEESRRWCAVLRECHCR